MVDDTATAIQAGWPARHSTHVTGTRSAEHNIALGARRAAAVREYFAGLGIRPDRIQTRSLGTEAPFCRSGESCRSQNGCGHFEITER
jgi:outer membrane protein OmpA-like peptidoglycan-associated protein